MRAIVPGHAGARNCKFLEKVSVTDIACKVRKTFIKYFLVIVWNKFYSIIERSWG